MNNLIFSEEFIERQMGILGEKFPRLDDMLRKASSLDHCSYVITELRKQYHSDWRDFDRPEILYQERDGKDPGYSFSLRQVLGNVASEMASVQAFKNKMESKRFPSDDDPNKYHVSYSDEYQRFVLPSVPDSIVGCYFPQDDFCRECEEIEVKHLKKQPKSVVPFEYDLSNKTTVALLNERIRSSNFGNQSVKDVINDLALTAKEFADILVRAADLDVIEAVCNCIADNDKGNPDFQGLFFDFLLKKIETANAYELNQVINFYCENYGSHQLYDSNHRMLERRVLAAIEGRGYLFADTTALKNHLINLCVRPEFAIAQPAHDGELSKEGGLVVSAVATPIVESLSVEADSFTKEKDNADNAVVAYDFNDELVLPTSESLLSSIYNEEEYNAQLATCDIVFAAVPFVCFSHPESYSWVIDVVCSELSTASKNKTIEFALKNQNPDIQREIVSLICAVAENPKVDQRLFDPGSPLTSSEYYQAAAIEHLASLVKTGDLDELKCAFAVIGDNIPVEKLFDRGSGKWCYEIEMARKERAKTKKDLLAVDACCTPAVVRAIINYFEEIKDDKKRSDFLDRLDMLVEGKAYEPKKFYSFWSKRYQTLCSYLPQSKLEGAALEQVQQLRDNFSSVSPRGFVIARPQSVSPLAEARIITEESAPSQDAPGVNNLPR